MTNEELETALDKSRDMLAFLNSKAGAKFFDEYVQLNIKYKDLDQHWWTKLGRFLHVYGRN